MKPLIIKATSFRSMEICHRRVWLDYNGDPDDRKETPQQRLLFMLGVKHEAVIHTSIGGKIKQISVPNWKKGVEKTLQLINQGIPEIIGGHLEASWNDKITIRGKVDRLRLYKLDGEWVYVPIEIKSYLELKPIDLVQMNTYLWLLSHIQTANIPGLFWLGKRINNKIPNQLAYHFDKKLFDHKVGQMLNVLESETPSINFIDECENCSWLNKCAKEAGENASVAILPELRKDTLQALAEANITTVGQIAKMSVSEMVTFRGIGQVRAKQYIANAQAWCKETPVWMNSLSKNCYFPGIFLDLETHELQTPWSWGLYTEAQSYVVLLAPKIKAKQLVISDKGIVFFVPDVSAGWKKVAKLVEDHIIYHWGNYDAGVVKRTAPYPIEQQFLPRMIDLYKETKNIVKLPILSSSLKDVAGYLGFYWSGYTDYISAYSDYIKWQKSPDSKTLERFCSYQIDDVKGLHHVWQWLIDNAPQ